MALHCCANCDHYRSSGSERCSVPDTPRVLDAAASNQCVSFAFRSLRVGEASQAAAQAGTDAKVRDFLLSESEEGAQAARADRKTWDQLFG